MASGSFTFADLAIQPTLDSRENCRKSDDASERDARADNFLFAVDEHDDSTTDDHAQRRCGECEFSNFGGGDFRGC